MPDKRPGDALLNPAAFPEPKVRPNNPNFGSGPCAKRPGWTGDAISGAALGRSHRSALGKAKLAEAIRRDAHAARPVHSSSGRGAWFIQAIDETHALLGLPKDYLVGIVPASDTGAVEMVMWSMLGEGRSTFATGICEQRLFTPPAVNRRAAGRHLPLGVLRHDLAQRRCQGGMAATDGRNHGRRDRLDRYSDAVKELKLENVTNIKAEFGVLPDLSKTDASHDIVFTMNGTTSGVRVPNLDWIPPDRQGLTICDATSAIFGFDMLPWEKLDVVTYSWQKVPLVSMHHSAHFPLLNPTSRRGPPAMPPRLIHTPTAPPARGKRSCLHSLVSQSAHQPTVPPARKVLGGEGAHGMLILGPRAVARLQSCPGRVHNTSKTRPP